MTHGEFRIGMNFFLGRKPWRVTDIGTRTVAAICLEGTTNLGHPLDESWFVGPPYAVQEEVLDEDDLPVCSLLPQEDDDE